MALRLPFSLQSFTRSVTGLIGYGGNPDLVAVKFYYSKYYGSWITFVYDKRNKRYWKHNQRQDKWFLSGTYG